MTRSDWFLLATPADLYSELTMVRTDRPLYLLTCAYLRRFWDLLPDKWVQAAVEATEAFAEGRASPAVTVHQWALAEYNSPTALWCSNSRNIECSVCAGCNPEGLEAEEYAFQRCLLPAAARLLDDPAWLPARAAFYARSALRNFPACDMRVCEERDAQLDLYRDLCCGPDGYERLAARPPADPDAGRLLRAVAREERPERAMLLALSDALEEEGGEQILIDHPRDPMPHFRGCWAVEVLTGRAGRTPRLEGRLVDAYRADRW